MTCYGYRMKLFLILPILLTVISSLCAAPIKLETLSLKDGKTYHNVTIRKMLPGGISIIHEAGAARIPFEKLSSEAVKEIKKNKATPEITVGDDYDILTKVDLRYGPGITHKKKINQKASNILKSICYLSIDSSTTVKSLAVDDFWVEVQVIYPEYLSDTHIGWIPSSAIKLGKSTNKKDGWMRHTGQVYKFPNLKSKPVGYIIQKASVSVADDTSGWLKLQPSGAILVRSLTTKQFLFKTVPDASLYIQTDSFTETIPSKW